MQDRTELLTASPLIRSAQELVPLLRDHAAEADRTGRLPQTVVKALREARLMSLGTPAALGGSEADITTVFEVHRTLAHGDASSAWVAMILSGSALIASALGDEARRELWGEDPLTTVCSCLPVCGTAQDSDDGMTVTGRWLPSSGVHHSSWALVAAARPGAEPVLALVPVAAGTIEQTWDTTGLRATRSDTLVLDSVHVPARRILPFRTLLSGGSFPGNPGLSPSRPFLPAALVGLAAPLLGMAEAAVEHTTRWLRERRVTSAADNPSQKASLPALNHLTDATARVDAARIVLRSLLADIEQASVGGPTDTVFRGRIHMLVAHAAAELREAVRNCITVFGSQGVSTRNPVERIWRDMETASTHVMVSTDRALEEYGPLLLQENGPQLLTPDTAPER